jgi:hypothetical protein
MSIDKLVSLMSRLCFLGAFVFAGLGVIERIANAAGYTVVPGYQHQTSRLIESAVVLLIFVIAMQLREMKQELKSRRS